MEQLRVEYLAREEKFTLEGDRKELLNIKQELDSLRSGLPGEGGSKSSGQSRHQSIDVGGGGGFAGRGVAVKDLSASVDSLSGAPPLTAPPRDDGNGNGNGNGNDDDELTAGMLRDLGMGSVGAAPVSVRASGDGDDVRASAGDLARLKRQGEELAGLSGYQPGDPLMQQIDRHKQDLEQKEFG